MEFEAQGKRPPKKRWRDVIKKDLAEAKNETTDNSSVAKFSELNGAGMENMANSVPDIASRKSSGGRENEESRLDPRDVEGGPKYFSRMIIESNPTSERLEGHLTAVLNEIKVQGESHHRYETTSSACSAVPRFTRWE
ncbi:hypothetical protein V3C99_018192 [Haemonchus contortus]|uniref:Uncharacterized protein n=1 Tax=Haemonchus contortus TaxID=6289 RepID=A0A7I4Z367_HAECO